jgi:hypothetical protein
LGESHEVKENCEFVGSLIKLLYQSGIRTLCTEFVPSRFNDRLTEIVTARQYDEAAVMELFRHGPWPTWGYQEYLDIIQAVWKCNRCLPRNADYFRIVGIDSDWKQVELLRAKSGAEKFRIIAEREKHMANVIERDVLAKNQKALVHVVYAHSVRQAERLASVLARQYG